LPDAGVPPVLLGDRADIYRTQKPGQIYLPSMAVTPHLGDDHGVAAEFQSVLLGSAEPGHHGAIVAIYRYQGAGVEN